MVNLPQKYVSHHRPAYSGAKLTRGREMSIGCAKTKLNLEGALYMHFQREVKAKLDACKIKSWSQLSASNWQTTILSPL